MSRLARPQGARPGQRLHRFWALLWLACALASQLASQLAQAAPTESVPILRRSEEGPRPDGSYNWSYETGNGIRAEESGELRPGGANDESIASVRGSYSYLADDGTPVELSYTADDRGFRPKGAHIPQPPEIPAAILRALEWIASHPEEDNL